MGTLYQTPGVYMKTVLEAPTRALRTGVPAFLGYATAGSSVFANLPQQLTFWSQFEPLFGPPLADGYLASAVRGFFENGGRLCYVVRLLNDGQTKPDAALEQGLTALTALHTVDLVCAPDIMCHPTEALRLQQAVLNHCLQMGDRFAILDAVGSSVADPNSSQERQAAITAVLQQREALTGKQGALYFPWVGVSVQGEPTRLVPPCGHVAGVYARSDERSGVYKAPANEVLEGVAKLAVDLKDADQALLNPVGVNCLRAFPGRGIRIWGARTLSREPAWIYVNVLRLFITAGRWIDHNLTDLLFEPHTPDLWARVRRDLTTYFNALFQQGALKGRSAAEAFYVKCDAETNPPEVRDAGKVVTEIGLAPALPAEFVIVRIIHSAGGITIMGATQPA